ncbi:hypothetical protein J2Y38_003829 [Flavobacterium sp. 2755]|uniref:hypothetical protein n=1 Tax=Flavobacterium sp. 2755 TaxID=2817765 RepID=UPI00285FE83C|nr:hypothetical protein [Flavobacterium sp. 2755]MDR6763608.1 hypothetical protein [Flavobacterium sp. 2755]
MGSKYFKRKKESKNLKTKIEIISIKSQLERLKASFPDLLIEELSKTKFIVLLKLRPDVFSKTYDVKIVYEIGKVVSVFVVNQKLKVVENRKKLPHVYDNDLQKICLYSKDGGNWTAEKSIVSTIVPWASEWLYYYEMWLIDGIWHGGGHNEYANENVLKDEQ